MSSDHSPTSVHCKRVLWVFEFFAPTTAMLRKEARSQAEYKMAIKKNGKLILTEERVTEKMKKESKK